MPLLICPKFVSPEEARQEDFELCRSLPTELFFFIAAFLYGFYLLVCFLSVNVAKRSVFI